MSDVRAITGTVGGRVQGVGFRVSAEWTARRLGLTGWVRNLRDGRVEVFAQGAAAVVDEFEAWLSEGPRAARVTDLRMASVDPDPSLASFTVR